MMYIKSSYTISYRLLPVLQIKVHVEIPESLKIVAEVPWSSEIKDDGNVASTSSSSSSHENKHLFTVQTLPPISLLCVLPCTYPSHSPPLFTLTCIWLNSKKLSSLCSCLDKEWEDTSPEVVVWRWAEWLRSQSLSYLGVSEELELGPYNEMRAGYRTQEEYDERAVSASESFDVDIPRLLRFNEETRNKEFLESLQECSICLTNDQPGNSH
jgi:E3 ubiquitin-protein ligase RNF14